MSRVLLVTMYSDTNFGNRLQNYALQKVLNELGFDVDNIKYDTQSKMKRMIRPIIHFVFKTFRLKYKGLDGSYLRAHSPRIKKFEKFNKIHILNIINIGCFNTEKLVNNHYDYVVTGSDQVWHNWYHRPEEMDLFYLSFIPKKKRIAYAPSFGFSDFPDEDREIHKKYLLGFEEGKISCREQTGTAIIRRETGLNAPTVPDPTLLLIQNDWRKLIKKPNYPVPPKYVLAYFLKETRAYNANLPVIEVCNYKDEEHFATGPDEFLWLVANAEHIYTNSFHACVFAIIFHKDFTVYRKSNEDMFDRIQTLLDGTGLEQCIESNEAHEINWDRVDEVISKRRAFGLGFLRKALDKESDSE